MSGKNIRLLFVYEAMPLQQELGASYVKVTKIQIDSRDRTTDSNGATDYVIDINKEIQYVVGMEMTGFDFPDTLIPSFTSAQNNTAGTNIVDFELFANGTVVSNTFSIALPGRHFEYQNLYVPYSGYTTTLESLLNDAIANDSDFGDGQTYEARFVVTPMPDLTTRVSVSGSNVDGFRFLFLTGSNSANSAYEQMGFTKADTAMDLEHTSPSATDLDKYRYVDISIEEVPELKPVQRLYLVGNSNDTVSNNPNYSRTRLLTDPVHRLRVMRFKLTLAGGIPIPASSGQEHAFTLTILSLSNETSIPKWVHQTFTL